MDKKYLEMAFLWGAGNYIDEKIDLEFTKKYASYKSKDGWDNLSAVVCDYVEGLNENQTIEFIKQYIFLLKNSKLQDNVNYEIAFRGIILGFVYGGFIHGNDEKYAKYSNLKQYLLNTLEEFEDGMNKTYSNRESISSYRERILKQFN